MWEASHLCTDRQSSLSLLWLASFALSRTHIQAKMTLLDLASLVETETRGLLLAYANVASPIESLPAITATIILV